jgi:capsular exopolysaccharide synthesis family protein
MKEKHLQQSGLKFSYKRIFKIISSRWYWLLATVCVALAGTYIYLSIAPKVYATEATLKFDEKRSEISELINVRNGYDRSNKIQSEQFVVRSREVLLNAAKRLNYPVAFYFKGLLNQVELYPLIPFKIIILEKKAQNEPLTDFQIEPISHDRFKLHYSQKGIQVRKIYKINELITTTGYTFLIAEKFKSTQVNTTYYIRFNEPAALLGRINKGLTMTENKNTNILSFSQRDENPVFAANILNAVLESYINYDQRQKTRSANQTIAFIDTLQSRLAQVVSNSGTTFEKFKVRSKMLNVSGITSQALNKLESLERQKADLELQILKTNLLSQQVQRDNASNSIDFDLQGIKDPLLSNLLTQFNMLLLKKQDQLSTYKMSSEVVRETEAQLGIIRQALTNNISAQQKRNAEASVLLQQQIAKNQTQLDQLPASEKDFISLQSSFDVNQKVYAYLNQKKLEAQISRASITAAATIVNKAMVQFTPVAPLKSDVYKTSIIIGLLGGIGLIFLVRAMNPYIFDRETLEQLTTTPIIGIIRKYPATLPRYPRMLLEPGGNTMFAESVRSLRTNISFLAPDISKKIICITSETPGEGKSFTALNLAHSLSLIDKRVLVIAADLRKSMLHMAFSSDNHNGLSNYLSAQAEFSQVIVHHSDKLSYITSGPVPPNPAELLYGMRMKSLLTAVKLEYDFVIIDSAPVGLVSDAVPMLKVADINLFIIRAGLSRYHAAVVPERLSTELGLNNFHIVLNAFNYDSLHSPYYSTNPYKDADASGTLRGYLGGNPRRRWWQTN